VAIGFAAVGFIVFVGIMASTRYVASERERQRREAESASLQPPDPVVAVVESKTLERKRKFTADVRPWVSAEVPAEVRGRVLETLVEAGQEVAKDDPIVRLDEARARIALEAAEARHAETTRILLEAEKLQSSRVVSRSAYEAAIAENRISRASLDEARDTLEKHTIRAPFSGIVNERLVDIGDPVAINQPVAELVDLDKLRVFIHVSETDLPSFPQGRKLPLRLGSETGEAPEPEVLYIARSADPSTRLFKIEAVMDNPGGRLPGGIQGVVEAAIQIYEGPVVPASAVRFAGSKSTVLRESGGEAVETEIVVGAEVDGLFPVLEGLSPGDRVLIQ
jgi:RND family efflux transporter MFP subunit